MLRLLRPAVVFGFLAIATACADGAMPVEPSPTPLPTPAVVPALPIPAPTTPVATTARYEVVFESMWTASTHPTDFPDDAHYSGLIGGTHTDAVSFWKEGALASEGIRRMAERGSKAPLDDEVKQAIVRQHAEFLLSGGALARTPGTISMAFDITRAYPLVTLVTMVAPSPDWFVGVSGVPLFVNGDWAAEVSVDLHVFDAGTDDGSTYRAPDEEARPRKPIGRLTGYPLAGFPGLPFGRLVFRRLDTGDTGTVPLL